jgi:pyrroloquinoline quinone biosynthesis protein E
VTAPGRAERIGLPRLRPGVRVRHDRVGGGDVLLYPEGAVLLNETAAAVVAMIDGTRDADGIAAGLERRYRGVAREDVVAVLGWLAERRLIEVGGG